VPVGVQRSQARPSRFEPRPLPPREQGRSSGVHKLQPTRRGPRARVLWRLGRGLIGRLALRSLYDHRKEARARALTDQARSGLGMNELQGLERPSSSPKSEWRRDWLLPWGTDRRSCVPQRHRHLGSFVSVERPILPWPFGPIPARWAALGAESDHTIARGRTREDDPLPL
jgi:hypothetical protein